MPESMLAPSRAATRPTALAGELQISLTRLVRRMRVHRSHDVKGAHFAVMTILADHGPMTPTQLAEQERVKPPTMTRTVNCLVEDGYAQREPHPSDGRQVVVALTERGLSIVKETRRRRDEWLTRQLAALTAAERETLAAASTIMRRLAAQ